MKDSNDGGKPLFYTSGWDSASARSIAETPVRVPAQAGTSSGHMIDGLGRYPEGDRKWIVSLRDRHIQRARQNDRTDVLRAEPPSRTDSTGIPITSQHGCLGGGPGYYDTFDERNADRVLRTKEDLLEAKRDLELWGRTGSFRRRGKERRAIADGGKPLFYVADGATINMGKTRVGWTRPVTLGGGRGRVGNFGTIRGDFLGNAGSVRGQRGMFGCDGNASGMRISGIGLRGPRTGFWEPGNSGQTSSYPFATGVECETPNVEVDNCEILGWSFSGVQSNAGGGNLHCHHNTIHDNAMNHIGYGFKASGNRAISVAEYNTLNLCRHTISSARDAASSYNARFNLAGPDRPNHSFDVHGAQRRRGSPGGGRIEIIQNTFAAPSSPKNMDGDAITFRGTTGPTRGGLVDSCWFQFTDKSRAILQKHEGRPPKTFADASRGGFRGITVRNNHHSPSNPPGGVGAPRGG